MDTLLLDVGTWDLTLDSSGNIAVATGAYAIAQDAASEIKLFQGELWYDTTQGVPYWNEILGLLPPLQLVKSTLTAAALLVPGAATAQCFISSFTARTLSGQVQVTNADGQTATVSF